MSRLKKLRDRFRRKKEVQFQKDPWGKESEIPIKSESSLKLPRIKRPIKRRITALAYIRILISAFIFLNMVFMFLGMLLNFYPSTQNAYLMWLFILSALTSMDYMLMKRRIIKGRSLEKKVFEEKTDSV